MFIYCPECGKKNDYDITKPKFCKKCGKDFVNIFKTAKASKTNLIDSDDEEYEIIRVKKSKKTNVGAENKTTKELDAEEFDDSQFESLGSEEVKGMAQEVKANLDVNDFITEFEDKTVNFKDIYAEAKRKAEQQK
jgi:hypothetical protein